MTCGGWGSSWASNWCADRETLEPAGREAGIVVNRMRDRGVLVSTDGPFHNVIKIKPPLVFTTADADRLVETLDGWWEN